MASKKQMQPMPPDKPSLKITLLRQMITLATSGFGLIAALAWNNVVQEVVDAYIKPYLAKGSGLISLLIYAIGITILAVTITYQLTKLVEKLEEKRLRQ